VAIPAVLAEHVDRVPEPGHGLFGHREGAEPGVDDPSLGRGAGRALGEELDYSRHLLPNSEIHGLAAGHFAWEQAADEYGGLIVDSVGGGYRRANSG
jgi:hypothetical protein